MRRQIPVIVVCGLVLLSVGLAVMLVLSMRSFDAYQARIDAEGRANPRIVDAEDVGYKSVIHGALYRPIGEEMTIHGTKFDGMWTTFRVDSVNGEKVSGLEIHVLGATHWPKGTEATIRGKEVSKIFLRQPGDFNSSPDDLSNKDRQIIVCAFKPLEVLEPKELALEEEKGW